MGKKFANVDHERRGSPLVHEHGHGHDEQPHGGRVGHGSGKAEHHPRMEKLVEPMHAHVAKNPLRNAHGFGNVRAGFLRHSGHPGAHRVGKR